MQATRFFSLLAVTPLLAVTWIAAALPLFAVTLQQMSLEQVTDASTQIVRARVIRTYTAQTGKTIFTHYVAQVSERWKGAADATVDVALPGGMLNGMRQSYPGVPALVNGRTYVLYLWTGTTGPTQPVGLLQGIFDVSTGENGIATVSRRASGEMMIDANGRAVVDKPVNVQLTQMRAHVDTILKGRPHQ